MTSPETYVGVAPDSTGKKIRNLQVQAVITDANGQQEVQNVLMQVINIADTDGRVLDLEGISYLPLILEELQEIREILESIARLDSRQGNIMTDTKP